MKNKLLNLFITWTGYHAILITMALWQSSEIDYIAATSLSTCAILTILRKYKSTAPGS